ncbi:MAG: hypothetical protein LUG83_03535, partial [Lachnospiraceae bacterium]|nr:hypothetical protein [Lachnospiraceae bacterium]
EADGLTEKALQIDANETIVSKEKGNRHKKNMLLAVCALLLIVIATGGVVYRNTSNGAKIRLVAERYEYIETWGKEVYQQAYVVDGEIDNEVVEQHMEKIKKKYLSDAGMAEKDFVMLFYYSDENAALNWEYTEYGGGFTLNSITEGERQ